MSEYKIQWEKFLVYLLIWITSVSISCMPLFLELWAGLKLELNTKTYNLALTLLEGTITDIDFLFVNITSLFMVWIEGYFTTGVLAKKIIQYISCICSIDFFLLYICFSFRRDIYNSLTNESKIILNTVFFILSALLVLFNNYLISMERDSQK